MKFVFIFLWWWWGGGWGGIFLYLSFLIILLPSHELRHKIFLSVLPPNMYRQFLLVISALEDRTCSYYCILWSSG